MKELVRLTPQKAKRLIESPVIQAFARGETIYFVEKDTTKAYPLSDLSVSNFLAHPEDYHLAPPKPREWWDVMVCLNNKTMVLYRFYSQAEADKFVNELPSRPETLEVVHTREVL